MRILTILFTALMIIQSGCSDETNIPDRSIPEPSEWLVPENQVFNGGPGKDGIPSIDDPQFTKASEIDFLNDDDLILGIRVDNQIKGYPHPILDWHEIVNDRIGNESIALTYCPLTGTGVGWDRIIDGVETTFGVSGLLYNTNLMPYDRTTNSTWSQQRLDCVNGEKIGSKAQLHSFIETSWGTWRQAFPDSEILNLNTGFSRNYSRYPYGDYRTNHQSLLFPVSAGDDRLPAKERVLGVRINEAFVAYQFSDTSGDLELISDVFNGQELIVLRSSDLNYVAAFKNPGAGTTFEPASPGEFPVVLRDSNGTRYDMLGFAMDESGNRLELPDQFMGYWFSWGAFYPNIDLY